ncbi:MAG: NAD(P)H-dependent oxidoreductase subunit E [Desulfotomaculaceae bacterium]|nr:NAD(P)H-dependent oxidoreductase subunit E [Desulfotomaculaceae bacterium]MDD4767186.1 NAD(P)H-dependent oxidoreductase subunit E [Desulfotomaculaceae bacterium]
MVQETYLNKKARESEIPESFVYGGIPEEKPDEKKIQENKFSELDRYINLYKKEPGQLIIILQKAQDIFGHLPEEVQAYIAEKTGTPVSEVNGVVTFYSLFSTEPRGKYTLDICMGTACYIKGAQELMDTLKDNLQVDAGETTRNRLFTVKSTRCIGACGLAPILVVNGEVHGNASSGEGMKIIQKYRKGEDSESKKH